MAPKFGTSGLRGLVCDLTDDLCARYVRAFLDVMPPGDLLYVGRDLRPSSVRIAAAVAGAADGRRVIDCGALPTPALALVAMAAGAPAVMVTGSHIPADRNGLKFYRPEGEITKADEEAISARSGAASGAVALVEAEAFDAAAAYEARYVDFFGPGALLGLRVGVYEHSTVARDGLASVLSVLGAEVVRFGRSDNFIPVDTEAVSPEMRAALGAWVREHGVDAIVSADGDADRPLLTDASGRVVPGDVLGALTAMALGADVVVTPVSSNTLIERCGAFRRTLRTRIGSPYVVAGIEEVQGDGSRPVGFEANGGFLLGFTAEREGRRLPPLLTRDAFLPILSVLAMARTEGNGVAGLLARLPQCYTAADRLEDAPTDRSQALVAHLSRDEATRMGFFEGFGEEAAVDLTDGLRVSFTGGLILHLRPSGNAPELRVYAEAGSHEAAEAAMREVLARARQALSTG
ncbi:phosphomannomutase [Frigidibacter sp. RF13]|uniref:phosphomannomutase n=1 Tax=Frigidibacter sp. RF13 TaxID=2997340 RepID=UPI0022719CC7|nr:phosphomannomutase [Frigidibacter sp. RF13]MCY1128197.1 phosphomannomutase [Frigidibacter sp. RF13]